MVIFAIFMVAAGLSFFFFNMEYPEGMGRKPIFDFPYRWLALTLALIGTGVFLAEFWVCFTQKNKR